MLLRVIKILSVLVIIISIISSIVLLAFGGLAGLLVVPFAIYLGYYLLILAFCNGLNKSTLDSKDTYSKILAVCCFAPIAIVLIAPYEVSEFLMSGIHLDMK